MKPLNRKVANPVHRNKLSQQRAALPLHRAASCQQLPCCSERIRFHELSEF